MKTIKMKTIKNSFNSLEDANNWIGDLDHTIVRKETTSHGYESFYYLVTVTIND